MSDRRVSDIVATVGTLPLNGGRKLVMHNTLVLLKVAGLLGPVGTPVAGKLSDVGVNRVLIGD
jgi:hypothetical protein